jgi:hypothetical protein
MLPNKSSFLLVPLLLLLISLCTILLSSPCLACMSESAFPKVQIGKETYVCLVINDRNITVWTPKADDFVRLVVQGSFNATKTKNACLTDKFWFPQGCPGSNIFPTKGVGAPPATNFYVSSMGVNSEYKKTYAYINYGRSNGPITISSWFPIVTAVIQVHLGEVQAVYWDDGCYYCPWSSEGSQPSLMNCISNAYALDNGPSKLMPPLTNVTKKQIDPAGHNGNLGYDCMMTQSACTQSGTGKSGFCDLGVYIVWTGTDINNHQFASAGRRFRRFRDYYMEPQFQAMTRFGGNNINSEKSITDNTLIGPPDAIKTDAPHAGGDDPYG